MARGIKLNLIGEQYGYLTVVAQRPGRLYSRGTFWLCRCECGQVCIKSANELRRKKGWVHSCGCRPALVSAIQLQVRGGIDRRLEHLHNIHRPRHS